jgi:hypothetical protein
LFSAAKNGGIVNKSTAFCSDAHRKKSELRTKAFFCSAAQRKFWNRDQKHCIWFSRAAKNFGIASKTTVFSSAAQRKFWNLPTNPTQTDCILFCRAASNLGIYQ